MFVPKYSHKKTTKTKIFSNKSGNKQTDCTDACYSERDKFEGITKQCQITEKNNKAQRMNFGKETQIVQNVSCNISINKRYFFVMH